MEPVWGRVPCGCYAQNACSRRTCRGMDLEEEEERENPGDEQETEG